MKTPIYSRSTISGSFRMDDKQLFDEVKISDVLKDIHETTLKKRRRIEAIIQQASELIKTADDAISLSPIIKDFYDVGIKNDEQLIKMLGVVTKGKSTSDSSGEILTEHEKEQLMMVAKEHAQITLPDPPPNKLTTTITS